MRFPYLVGLCFCLPATALAGTYTTYIGDQFAYSVAAMTKDAAGDTYLTGGRSITPIPYFPGDFYTDVFIIKLDTSGNIVSTFTLTGKGSDRGNGIAVDSSGNIWVAGVTTSPDFPLHNPLQSTLGSFGNIAQPTGFLTQLAPDGSILFSTFLGGTEAASTMNAVAVDAAGNAYVTGTTGVPYAVSTVYQAYFAEVSAAGGKIIYSGTVGASGHACEEGSSCFLSSIPNAGIAIAVDPAGSAYIAGNAGGLSLQASIGGATFSASPGGLQPNGIGAFIVKVNASGSGLVYLTSLGTANYTPGSVFANPGTSVSAIAADAAGNAYITGATSDPAFPTTPSAFQPVFSIPVSQINPFDAPPSDAFAAKLNPSGTAMVWATYLGGTGADVGDAIAVEASGNVWVSGTTTSTDFPATGGIPQGPEFLVEFNPTGSALLYGSRVPANTTAAAITAISNGIVVAGATGLVSSIVPSQSPAPQLFGIANAAGGVLSGRIAPGELISL